MNDEYLDIDAYSEEVDIGNTATFSDWWSQVLSVHDYAIDPKNPTHFYDYESAYHAGVEIPEKGEDWPSKFKHDLHPDRFVIGEDAGQPEYEFWDTKYDEPADATDMIRQQYQREEFLENRGVFD
jgi:hypothetical protein